MTGADRPQRALVIGAGTIGAGVAALLAVYEVPVTMLVRRRSALTEASDAAAVRLGRLAALGAIDESRVAPALARISSALDITEGTYDLVFEAIHEDLQAKRSILGRAETALAADGIIASTTSSIPIGALADGLRRPERMAGWHWFHPADLLPLVEVIPAASTPAECVDRLQAWSRTLGKTPVLVQEDVPGFVANRLQYALLREAYALVEHGVCAPRDIEAAVTAGLGMRWASTGPFTTMDLAGLDVHEVVCRQLFPALERRAEVPATLSRLRQSGASGAKAGAGILGDYPPERTAAIEERRDRTIIALRRSTPAED